MPEGLSPIEASKKLHEHTSEPSQPDATWHSRIVQIGEAVLLSLVTIAAAWSGYAAARWGTESRIELAQAATLRNLATRADLAGAVDPQLRLLDLHRLVHRLHPGQPPKAGHRRAALPTRVQGGLRRLDR
jgi:hypothetical protein